MDELRVTYVASGKAQYDPKGKKPLLIGLLDSRDNWYMFDTRKGLVLATDDEIAQIKSFRDEFDTVTDSTGDVYAALLDVADDKPLLVLRSATGIAYKFNRVTGLIELPNQNKPHGAFFNTDLK